nr:hypothetical protein B11C_100006 [Bartonella sp. 1-1C]
MNLLRYAQIAQLVEQRTENPRVRGSNPRLGTVCFFVIYNLLILCIFFKGEGYQNKG